MAARSSRFKAVVDRVEDGRTVVLTVKGGGEFALPVDVFSGPPREGAVFDVTFRPDEKAESSARARVSRLQQALLKRNRPAK